jgi:hypothetical protein
LEFKEIDPNSKLVYFELVLYNKITKFQEAVGITSLEIKKMEKGNNKKLTEPLKMTYKGKESGLAEFTYDYNDNSL